MHSSQYPRECYDLDHENKEHNSPSEFEYKVVSGEDNQPLMAFTHPNLTGRIIYDSASTTFNLSGKFSEITGQPLKYWAANPIPRMYSYSGSGLPFPNPEVAYENSPNQGEVMVDATGQFNIALLQPSGYYTRQGKVLMKPHVHFRVPGYNRIFTITIADDFPYRSLSNLPDRPNRSIGR
jgi:hypothetical protein